MGTSLASLKPRRRRRSPRSHQHQTVSYYHCRYVAASYNCVALCTWLPDSTTALSAYLPETATRSSSWDGSFSDDWRFPSKEARDFWRERRAQKISRITRTSVPCTPQSGSYTDPTLKCRPLKDILKNWGRGSASKP